MDLNKARLKWLCRRGMKELDVVLERYLATRFDAAPERERNAFAGLLDSEDPEIWSWVMGYEALPADERAAVIEQLRQYR
ncbi:MAG TPA: succinate dehydrogenase assembly factor 2 [Stenotrophobium sp.]|jgi:antitoxin CptB|nr:succinate dehydrogenase assembly factor 2 [Stenotrophobium sp.]